MRRLLTAASAAALALALAAAAPAAAQDQQTTDAVMNGMAQLGMDTEGMDLSEEQVLQIQSILSEGTETDEEKVRRIEEIVGDDG